MTRILDIPVAGIALVALSPVLALAAVAIALESRGGVIYRHERIGRDGRPFELWKLRTMVSGAERMGAGLYIEANDSRITRSGALLRRFSLDELPNLVNVLRGEMAIVGPRPTIQAQVDDYTPLQRRRHEVLPGITGWAQVQGRAGIPWEQRIVLDVDYVDRRSTALDARILAKTLWLVLTGRGLAPD